MPEVEQQCPECGSDLIFFPTCEGRKWVCKGDGGVQHRGLVKDLLAPTEAPASAWDRLKGILRHA